MDGVLVIDKPAGMTSHDVVDSIRRRFKTRRVGHAGTLDPDATGLLIVGLGKATRFLDYAQRSPKRYLAGAVFGATTTTQDASGEELSSQIAEIDSADVEAALGGFRGDTEQVPPMVSAVKVGGERLYRKARRGEEVERTARPITVYSCALVDFTAGERPAATLDITCSAGTYVRTLIHDLGRALGCGAYMSSLRRIENGGFAEMDARPLDVVGPDDLRPILDAVKTLPRVTADAEMALAVGHGRSLPPVPDAPQGEVAIVRDGDLLGVYLNRDDALTAQRVVPS